MTSRASFIAHAARTLAAFGAAGAGASAQTAPEGSTIVHTGGTITDDNITVLYALKAGLFQRAGLDVRVERANNGSAVAAAMISGTYDIGKSSILSIFDAYEKGLPFTIVAPCSVYVKNVPYIVSYLLPKGTVIRSGKDFNNKIVGVGTLSSFGKICLMEWIDKHGGDPTSVQFLEVPLVGAAGAVEQGRVMTAEISNPALQAALDTGKFKIFDAYDAMAPSFVPTVWFTTREYSARHPEVVRTFARILGEAARYTNGHHAETAPILAEWTSVPLSVILHMARANAPSAIDPAQIQPVIDASAKYGGLKRAFPAQAIIDANTIVK